nr:uncharacterized protein LOC112941714 [Solanum lycopersicum]
MASFSQWINEGLYKHHAKKGNKEDHYLFNCSKLEFDQLDLVVAFSMNKDWFYVMSPPNRCWNEEYVDVIFYYLRKKSKQQIHSKYQYTTTSYFFKTYIDNSSEHEDKIIDIMKGYAIPFGMSWHLMDDVYVPANSNAEFHWVLAVVALKERCIKVYDSMSSNRSNRKLSSEIQKMVTMLPKYLVLSGFFKQNERTNWSVLKGYQGKNKSLSFEVSLSLILPNKKAVVCKYNSIILSYDYRNNEREHNPDNFGYGINNKLHPPVDAHNQVIVENPDEGALKRQSPAPRPQEYYRGNVNIADSDGPLVLPPLPQGHSFMLKDVFLARCYPISKNHNHKDRVNNFMSLPGESVSSSWDRFTLFMRSDPNRRIDDGLFKEYFYRVQDDSNKAILDTTAGGSYVSALMQRSQKSWRKFPKTTWLGALGIHTLGKIPLQWKQHTT